MHIVGGIGAALVDVENVPQLAFNVLFYSLFIGILTNFWTVSDLQKLLFLINQNNIKILK